ncbi:MAG TPA: OadG family transporter subunit [bacterium]|nr:OadG family transporter subunit [bacterium]
MIHSINFLQIAAGAFEGLSKSEQLIIKTLPFLGISVVIGGLSILAIILTQFKRLGEGKGHGHGHAAKPAEKKKTEEPVADKPAQNVSDDQSEMDQYVAAIALSLYISENSEKVYLTEVNQFHNQNPWTSAGIFSKASRFKKWQSLKK